MSAKLDKGEHVTVFAMDAATGRPYIAGTGVITMACPEQHFFDVQLAGEKFPRRRQFVPAEWQSEPERHLELLVTMWRASRAPNLDDFFPNSISDPEV